MIENEPQTYRCNSHYPSSHVNLEMGTQLADGSQRAFLHEARLRWVERRRRIAVHVQISEMCADARGGEMAKLEFLAELDGPCSKKAPMQSDRTRPRFFPARKVLAYSFRRNSMGT